MTLDKKQKQNPHTRTNSTKADIPGRGSASENSIAEVLETVNTEDTVGAMEAAEASGVQYSRFVEEDSTHELPPMV